MAKFWGGIGLISFVFLAVVHVSTMLPGLTISAPPWFGYLLLAPLCAFLATIISFSQQEKRFSTSEASGSLPTIRTSEQENVTFEESLTEAIPDWAMGAGMLGGIWVLLNFILMMILTESGNTETSGGEYYIGNRTETIDVLSEKAYRFIRGFEIRTFTGVGMFFFSIPTVYFFSVLPKLQSQAEAQEPPNTQQEHTGTNID